MFHCYIDIDECVQGGHGCDVNANCTNTLGSNTCQCRMGFTGQGGVGDCTGELWTVNPEFLLSRSPITEC